MPKKPAASRDSGATIKVGRLIALQANPLEEREDIGKLIRKEMEAALKGSGFFDEMAAYAGAGLGHALPREAVPAPAVAAIAKSSEGLRPKRKLTDKMKRRNEIARRLMREEGLSLPAASRAVKERGLA